MRPYLADPFLDFFQHPLKALLLSFLAGSMAALAMAPLNFWPALFISLSILYALLASAPTKRRAFGLGWLFGFGYFLFSLSWIGNALLVEGNPYRWAWPLAVSGLPALLAFFPALATLASHKLVNLRSVSGWFGFSALLCGFEWLRGHVFTGFPWNLFGYTWAEHLPMLQILWLSDVYLLSFLTILWASAIGAAIFVPVRQRAWPIAIMLVSIAGAYGYGIFTLPDKAARRDDLNIRIVQPNIDQAEKWQRDKMAGHFRKHLMLSASDEDSDTPNIIVWPETAMSYRLFEEPAAMADLKAMLQTHPENSALLTGFLRRDHNAGSYSNSLVMVARDGQVSNIYDKHHLVPFGEYIPFQDWIPLTPIVQFKGFTKGIGPQTHTTPGGQTYSPLVCYEVIFPGRSVAQGERPDFIVNVTNDAWYGLSAGPHQHFTQAIYRAIETGVPVIRAANTGISAVISPYGEVLARTALFAAQTRTAPLPKKRIGSDAFLFPKHITSVFFLVFFIFAGTLGRYRLSQDS